MVRVPTKKWFKKTIGGIGIVIITYTALEFIVEGTLLNIELDMLLVICLVFLIIDIVLIGKEDLE